MTDIADFKQVLKELYKKVDSTRGEGMFYKLKGAFEQAERLAKQVNEEKRDNWKEDDWETYNSIMQYMKLVEYINGLIEIIRKGGTWKELQAHPFPEMTGDDTVGFFKSNTYGINYAIASEFRLYDKAGLMFLPSLTKIADSLEAPYDNILHIYKNYQE